METDLKRWGGLEWDGRPKEACGGQSQLPALPHPPVRTPYCCSQRRMWVPEGPGGCCPVSPSQCSGVRAGRSILLPHPGLLQVMGAASGVALPQQPPRGRGKLEMPIPVVLRAGFRGALRSLGIELGLGVPETVQKLEVKPRLELVLWVYVWIALRCWLKDAPGWFIPPVSPLPGRKSPLGS